MVMAVWRLWVVVTIFVLIPYVNGQLIIDDPEYRDYVRAQKYYDSIRNKDVPYNDQEATIANWCGERFGKSYEKCERKLQDLCNIQHENFTQTCPFLLRQKRAVGRTEKVSKQDLSSLKNTFNQLGQQFLTALFAPKSGNGPQGDVAYTNDARVTKNEKSKPSPNELTYNDPDGYFHGDVDLSKSQANYLLGILQLGAKALFGNNNGKRKRRKVGKEPAYHLWTENPIPYQFHPKVPAATRNIIEQAIQLWQTNTCRRWAKDILGEDRVEFVNGDGCSSYVGKTGGVQEISIMTPGCDRVGIASHELGHSLGFFHEQARPDQPDNVIINKANILPARLNNFVQMPLKDVNTYGMNYDYGSVMHYDGLTKGFTRDSNKYSIVTKDAKFQNTIGQRIGPSFIDYKLVNMAYCSGICQTQLGCTHNGYEDPNNCNQCKCPTGLGGRLCDTVAPSSPGCGGVIKASSQGTYITSPGFPNNYPSDKECNWYIIGPSNGKIYLTFTDSFNFPCDEVCTYSYVEVKRFIDVQRTGYRYCCDKLPEQIVSEGNEMIVMFKSNGDPGRGFRAKISTDGSGGVNIPVPTAPPPLVPTIAPVTSSGGVTPTNPNGCNCGEWSEWSRCTQPCGGCGFIYRQRPCNKNDCYSKEKKHCNFQQCQQGTNILYNNGQFDLLFSGCCVGFFATNGQCGGLNQAVSQFLTGSLSGK